MVGREYAPVHIAKYKINIDILLIKNVRGRILIKTLIGGNYMENICKECWNEDCRNNEKLRLAKVDVCIHMHEYPELWKEDDTERRPMDFKSY
jgi:predicted metal-binding protein